MRKFFELVPLAIAIGLTVEVFKPAIPYLPLIWLVVLSFYTWDIIKAGRILSFANRIKSQYSGRRLMFSYFLVAALGAALFVFYWWSLNSILASKIATYEAEQHTKTSLHASRFEQYKNPELRDAAIKLANQIRRFIFEKNVEQSNLVEWRMKAMHDLPKDTTEQERTRVWNSFNQRDIELMQKEGYEYQTQFGGDSVALQREILERLPPGSADPKAHYDPGSNIILMERVANDLERLAKSLP